MVFTERVRITRTGLGRRRLLGAAAGIGLSGSTTALAGCGVLNQVEIGGDRTGRDKSGQDRQPATPDVLQPVLDEAIALAATYDRAAVVQPALSARLTPLAADHRAHAAELARVIGKAEPAAPVAGVAPSAGARPAAVLADLRKAEQAAQKTAVTACKQAPATRAALAGSIAACRASHVEALR